ncbi:MAG: 2-dehydropantoate 2-reductase [Pirellulaceae bacterium]|jgi:2-dehydropantoate 2-reductase
MNTLLKITGQVAHPLELTFESFRQIAPDQQVDMSEIDERRRGRAVKLGALLDQSQPSAEAKQLKLIGSADGYESVISLALVRERGLVIYEIDGAPLPKSAGGPTRFFIRDHSACNVTELDACANVKFLDCIELIQ